MNRQQQTDHELEQRGYNLTCHYHHDTGEPHSWYYTTTKGVPIEGPFDTRKEAITAQANHADNGYCITCHKRNKVDLPMFPITPVTCIC
jgi:hypothetical protein